MRRHPRRNTEPELRLRRLLHAAGYRFRVQYPVPGTRRRTIDIAFTRRKLAVFIDGCFWHECPVHGSTPRANREWWAAKFTATRLRDTDTNNHLSAQGWNVLRIWEHVTADRALLDVVEQLES